ncbi:MAG: hypothetical protein RXR17_06955 [Sulfolobaceae archaeon]
MHTLPLKTMPEEELVKFIIVGPSDTILIEVASKVTTALLAEELNNSPSLATIFKLLLTPTQPSNTGILLNVISATFGTVNVLLNITKLLNVKSTPWSVTVPSNITGALKVTLKGPLPAEVVKVTELVKMVGVSIVTGFDTEIEVVELV